MRFRFSPKLRLALLWPALAALIAVAATLWVLVPRRIQEGTASDLLAVARLASRQLEAAPRADLQEVVRALTEGTPMRVTLVRSDGVVIADSARSAGQLQGMDNHAGRPEIRDALATGQGSSVRRSDTTGVTYAYAARTLVLPGDRLLVVRVARPVAELGALRGSVAGAILVAAAVALAAMAGVSWWLTRSLFQPLSRIITGAHELAAGGFSHRVEVPDERELATLATALNRLGGEVEKQIAAAGAERDHLQAILASMSEAVLVTDRSGRALMINPAFRRLFGVAGEVAGKRPLEIARHPRLARMVGETLDGGEAQADELLLEAPERRLVALDSTALPGRAGAAVVARDVSAVARLAEMRRDFVANVSHELKTPLAAIRGYAETLRDGALDDRDTAARFTERILRQCRRLQELLEDLLTLSRLESIGDLAEPTMVDLEPLVRRAFEVVAGGAGERRVEMALCGTAPPVAGDPDALERMVLNLIDNAVKYNRPGGRVDVELRGMDGSALLEVRDTGIGIAPEALRRIFERFYRVDQGRARDEGGTGLGLAIVKHVAHSHGGRVEVDSEPGKGSTFRVLLPLSRSDP